MSAIDLKKMELQDLIVLQKAVYQLRLKGLGVLENNKINDAYFNNILVVDVTTSLFFKLRMKIEKQTKALLSFRLKMYEAVILLQCCSDYNNSSEHEKFITRKYFAEIHKQIVNL